MFHFFWKDAFFYNSACNSPLQVNIGNAWHRSRGATAVHENPIGFPCTANLLVPVRLLTQSRFQEVLSLGWQMPLPMLSSPVILSAVQSLSKTPFTQPTCWLSVLEVINQDKIRTGWIKKVIFREDKVFFLVSSKVCTRTTMRFFQSLKVVGVVQLICVDSIKSYKPLIPFFSMAN